MKSLLSSLVSLVDALQTKYHGKQWSIVLLLSFSHSKVYGS